MIYEPCCQKCESDDLLFDYNTDIYTCNNCGTKMPEQKWKAILKADIDTTFAYFCTSRRQSILKTATE